MAIGEEVEMPVIRAKRMAIGGLIRAPGTEAEMQVHATFLLAENHPETTAATFEIVGLTTVVLSAAEAGMAEAGIRVVAAALAVITVVTEVGIEAAIRVEAKAEVEAETGAETVGAVTIEMIAGEMIAAEADPDLRSRRLRPRSPLESRLAAETHRVQMKKLVKGKQAESKR